MLTVLPTSPFQQLLFVTSLSFSTHCCCMVLSLPDSGTLLVISLESLSAFLKPSNCFRISLNALPWRAFPESMSQKPQPLLIVASFPYFIIPCNQPKTVITDEFHDCFLSLLIFELSKSPLPLADLKVPEICPRLCSEGQEQRESYQLAF